LSNFAIPEKNQILEANLIKLFHLTLFILNRADISPLLQYLMGDKLKVDGTNISL
jgi:hypothetical protein